MLIQGMRETASSSNQTTLFGLPMCRQYQRPERGYLYRADLLICLKEKLGDSIYLRRNMLYTIVSGESESDKEYRKVLTYLYKRYDSFANYVDSAYYFGDEDEPLLRRIIVPMLKDIEEYKNDLLRIIDSNRGEYLYEDRAYLYFLHKRKRDYILEGVSLIV